jgi:sigma-E factor negative regulatory protein RseC
LIEQYARVVEVQGQNVRVLTERQPGCQSCEVKGGCGTSLIGRLFPQRPEQLLDLSAGQLTMVPRPGDRVLIGIDEQHLQQAGLLLYATPLAGLLLGAICGATLGAAMGVQAQEPMSIISGLLGLSLGLLYVKRRSAARSYTAEGPVRLLRVAPAPFEVTLPAMPQHDTGRDI